MSTKRAFTLIELLVVVAIIAILAAIAVPNFLEAQVRSKVSRAKSDLRSVATSLEAYRVDYNKYPPDSFDTPLLVNLLGHNFVPDVQRLTPLTTPVAFISALPTDPFDPGNDPLNQLRPRTYHYVTRGDLLYPGMNDNLFYDGENEEKVRCEWMTQSYGPDSKMDKPENDTYWQFPQYDATNGTVSIGNVLRWGP